MKNVTVGSLTIANDRPFTLIAGPCQLESLDHARMLAGAIAEMTADLNIPYIFKASYDKANRSSVSGGRGVGIEKGLDILAAIRDEFGCPVITDIHEPHQAARAAD
ncbi:MAG: 3-deoxy-8-phosphooctulonate synthase, partial [Pseudomonadota bacterium]|nr:3-deoxy-8-phosphooctulonate synthase [Pseudomonadota bacterium]